MKVSIFLALVTTLNASAILYSQNTKITLTVKDKSVTEVIKMIEQQSDYRFFFSDNYQDLNSRVTIDVENENIEGLLTLLLENKAITYKLLENGIIVITPKVKAQQKAITGTVTDGLTGEPLPGVNIIIEGTSRGTVTDASGNFSMDITGETDILVFSFVGYNIERISAAGKTTVDVALIPDIKSLEEIVVIGYGTVRKSDLTGAVASIKGDKLNNLSASGIDRMLQGAAAGVQISSASGAPGRSTTIRIRGTGSLNAYNEPLYVIDGVPLSSIAINSFGTGAGGGITYNGAVTEGSQSSVVDFINPQDVESIEVLKDASAAAIYGSRGANGVIMITTKHGKQNIAPRLSFEAYYGTKKPWRKPEMANSAEYVQNYLIASAVGDRQETSVTEEFRPYYYLIRGTDENPTDFTQDFGEQQRILLDTLNRHFTETTDWWDELITKARVQNYNVSLVGGSDKFAYAASFAYYNEDGTIKSTNYDRYTFRSNNDFEVNKRLKIGTNLSLVYSSQKGILEDDANLGIISSVMQIDPLSRVYRTSEQADSAGGDGTNPFDLYGESKYTNRFNKVAWCARNIGETNKFRITGNTYLNVEIIKGLAFKSNFSITLDRNKEYAFAPAYFISSTDRFQNNSVRNNYESYNSWTWQNQLSYFREIGKHNVSVMAATEAFQYNSEILLASKDETPSNSENTAYFDNAIVNPQVFGGPDEGAILSYLGRINYTFNDKYFLTASLRRDGSSKFINERQWGNFPSFSLAWKISNEEFFKLLGLESVNLFKVRGGWGQLGNQGIPTNAFYSTVTNNPGVAYPFGPSVPYSGMRSSYSYHSTTPGIERNFIGNPLLKWEITEQQNYGIDIMLFKNKLVLTADYFNRTTKDALDLVQTQLFLGYPNSPWGNIASIRNKGYEFTVEYQDRISDVEYNIGVNLSAIRNKVLDIGSDSVPVYYSVPWIGNGQITEEGYGMHDFYGYKTDGIFQSQAEIDAYVNSNNQKLQRLAIPGDLRFVDINNDGVINDLDQQHLGSPLPKAVYGMNLGLGWKGISLNLSFQGQYGNKILMIEKAFDHNPATNYNSVAGYAEMAWHGPGTSDTEPIMSTRDFNRNHRMSDYYLEDGSYLRLKNVELAYDIPLKIIKKAKMSGIRLFWRGENLVTFTDYPGLEPDLDAQLFGASQYPYTQPKSNTIGIKVIL